jgi:hypothetical protein
VQDFEPSVQGVSLGGTDPNDTLRHTYHYGDYHCSDFKDMRDVFDGSTMGYSPLQLTLLTGEEDFYTLGLTFGTTSKVMSKAP